MQTAHALVALGGDKGNTVPKFDLTAAEIAVLRSIHGPDSVFEIEPVGEIERGSREERNRLRLAYPAKDEDGNHIVDLLYPGAGARVYEGLDELELPEEAFKAEKRMTVPSVGAAPRKGRRPPAAEPAKAEPEATKPAEMFN